MAASALNRNAAIPDKMPRTPLTQQGALPFRARGDGGIEVALVTTRETQRWIIPKGWLNAGESPAQAAAREALEEAGLVGRIVANPLGGYRYGKRRRGGRIVECRVTIHPLAVEEELADWPERNHRERRWVPAEHMALTVEEDGLSQFLGTIDLTAVLWNALGD